MGGPVLPEREGLDRSPFDVAEVPATAGAVEEELHPEPVLHGPLLLASASLGGPRLLPRHRVRPGRSAHRLPRDLLPERRWRLPLRPAVPVRRHLRRAPLWPGLQIAQPGFDVLGVPAAAEPHLDLRPVLAAHLCRFHDPEPQLVDPMKLKAIEVLVLAFMVLMFGGLLWKFFHPF